MVVELDTRRQSLRLTHSASCNRNAAYRYLGSPLSGDTRNAGKRPRLAAKVMTTGAGQIAALKSSTAGQRKGPQRCCAETRAVPR